MKLIIAVLIFLFPFFALGQQYLMSDIFVNDGLSLNPAYAGSQEALYTNVLYHNYLSDIDGSPKTMSMSIHAPFRKEKVGLGIMFITDKIGVSTETNLMGNYAYRIDLGYGKLALGLGFGMTISTTDWANLAAQDQGDDLLAQNFSTGPLPNFSTGIYYTTRKYFLGFSVPLFLTYKFDESNGKYHAHNDFANYNYFLNTGYMMKLGESVRFLPSVLLKYHQGNSSEAEINSQLIIKEKAWIGLGYKSTNSIVVMLQYQINPQLRIAYSHDFMVGEVVQYKYSSQGIMLNYIFKYNAEVAGPRQF